MTPPSLYIHIPFCRKKCPYCNFYSVDYSEELAAEYVDTILRQVESLDGAYSSVYIGGGTPSVLSEELLARLLGGLSRYLSQEAEFTIETNPESLNKQKLALFLDSGVNRISIGVQSFKDAKIKSLGRIHSSLAAKKSILLAYKSGFRNISIDLIFGLWDETADGWKEELRETVSFPLTHISCYGLSYEKGTRIYERLRKGNIVGLEDEVTANMYEWAMQYLQGCGFIQYEVSNFSKGGFVCRHNLNYWENSPYFGLGPSAVSYIDGIRQENIRDVREYIEKVKAGESYVVFQEKLVSLDRARETAALKIRTSEGINYNWFRKRTGFDFIELESIGLQRVREYGLIADKHKQGKAVGICLSPKGFLFCDTVSSLFL